MQSADTERIQTSETGKPQDETRIEEHVGVLSWPNLLWPLLLSLLVLFAIGWINHQPGTWLLMWRALHVWILLGALALLTLRVFASAWRLNHVSHGHLPARASIRAQLLWDFSSTVTPSLIGGGPVAALLISRDSRMALGEVTSVMLFVMLLDQVWFAIAIVMLVGASLFVNVYPDSLGLIGSTLFTVFFLTMLAWTAFFAYATLVNPRVLHSVVKRATTFPWLRRFRHRADLEMESLKDRAAVLRSESAGFFAKGFLITLVIWACRYFSLLLLVWSVYPALPKVDFFFRTVAMLTGSLLIPTPGGSGGIEGMYALFFSALMPGQLLAPTLLAWRFLAYYIFVAIGVVLSAQLLRGALLSRPSGHLKPNS